MAYTGETGEFPYPIIADEKRDLAVKLGMVDPVEKDKSGLPLTCRAVSLCVCVCISIQFVCVHACVCALCESTFYTSISKRTHLVIFCQFLTAFGLLRDFACNAVTGILQYSLYTQKFADCPLCSATRSTFLEFRVMCFH